MARSKDPLEWKKSSWCGEQGSCVEIAIATDGVFVRRTNDREAPVLCFPHLAWADLIAGIRNGDFEQE
ncbi:MAG: hypothetical protein AUI14_18490 [Actinobacteria bacterium 13_2_20CM_2_71_6]|nr:MAG: hypothetical protein AUI14_18490 [Actinobacteria bacterium 13_2_20CM_2_71_6]